MADDKKYEVEPSGENIRTIFDYHGDISSFIDWAEEKSMTVKKLEDEYQDVLDSVKVYSAGKVKFVAAEHGDYYRVLLIRTSKDDTTVDDYLERGKFAQINHGKEEFTIRAFDVNTEWYVNRTQTKYSKRTNIIAKCEIFDMADYEEQLMPDTNYKFYHDKKQVATMFLFIRTLYLLAVLPSPSYLSSCMTASSPTPDRLLPGRGKNRGPTFCNPYRPTPGIPGVGPPCGL